MSKTASKQKKGNIWALIAGLLIFIAIFFTTSIVNRYTEMGLASGKIPPEMAPAYRNINGVFSQIQVLAAVLMVMLDGKRGFIAAIAIETYNTVNILFKQVIMAHNYSTIPGVITAAVSLVILSIIYIVLQKNEKLHNELTANYEQLIEQNRIIEAKDKSLIQLAYYDRLTGLPNSSFFTEKIQEYIDNSTPFALIYMDMDNFKQINDNFGHECGDELIKVYADRFEKYCGSKYTCAKVGGDEFGMILVGKYTEADMMNIISQLHTLFAEPVQVGGTSFTITMSYGICGYPNDGGTPENLINAADTALYNAKINGKDRPIFYNPNSLG